LSGPSVRRKSTTIQGFRRWTFAGATFVRGPSRVPFGLSAPFRFVRWPRCWCRGAASWCRD
jgi:hypothetical protein